MKSCMEMTRCGKTCQGCLSRKAYCVQRHGSRISMSIISKLIYGLNMLPTIIFGFFASLKVCGKAWGLNKIVKTS